MKLILLLAALAWLPAVDASAAAPRARDLLGQPAAWFAEPAGRAAVSNILSWESPHGSWPKNTDTTKARPKGKKVEGTFDNGATTDELRLLTRAHAGTGDTQCRDAVLRGIDGILKAQYPNGGWPQYYPPPARSYHRHITFNDNSMVRLLQFLREVAHDDTFRFVGDERRAAARRAMDAGVECILRCQVRVQGRPTVWCAQHDAVDLSPQSARAYELASLSGSESAGILLFLMSLEQPSPAVIHAVTNGVAWFARAALTGIRVEKRDGDRVVVPDPAAPPLWARFYDLETNRPIFCGRDGIRRNALSEIEKERRTGYSWYGDWGRGVADRFAVWRTTLSTGATPAAKP